MTERSYKFYCNVCFADRESDCICDRIVGYDAVTGYPCVDMTDEEYTYLYNRSVSEARSQEPTPEVTEMLPHDINFVCELGDSKTGEIARYELSQMYDIPLNEIERLIRLKETMN
jgi:hypothetical protein